MCLLLFFCGGGIDVKTEEVTGKLVSYLGGQEDVVYFSILIDHHLCMKDDDDDGSDNANVDFADNGGGGVDAKRAY